MSVKGIGAVRPVALQWVAGAAAPKVGDATTAAHAVGHSAVKLAKHLRRRRCHCEAMIKRRLVDTINL
jgi:hypothetical protein